MGDSVKMDRETMASVIYDEFISNSKYVYSGKEKRRIRREILRNAMKGKYDGRFDGTAFDKINGVE